MFPVWRLEKLGLPPPAYIFVYYILSPFYQQTSPFGKVNRVFYLSACENHLMADSIVRKIPAVSGVPSQWQGLNGKPVYAGAAPATVSESNRIIRPLCDMHGKAIRRD